MTAVKKYSFTAMIERGTGGGAFVRFPHDVEIEFGLKGSIAVEAIFEDFSYTGSLMPCAGAQPV